MPKRRKEDPLQRSFENEGADAARLRRSKKACPYKISEATTAAAAAAMAKARTWWMKGYDSIITTKSFAK